MRQVLQTDGVPPRSGRSWRLTSGSTAKRSAAFAAATAAKPATRAVPGAGGAGMPDMRAKEGRRQASGQRVSGPVSAVRVESMPRHVATVRRVDASR
jgi:hypothetical protein